MMKSFKRLKIAMGGLLAFSLAATPLLAADSSYNSGQIAGRNTNYVTIDMSKAEAKVMLPNGAVNNSQAVSTMAEANGAFAAINGTYFSAYDGNPIPWGTVMRNGKLLHTGGGAVMGFTDSGKLLIDRVEFSLTANVSNGQYFYPWRINHHCEAADAIVIYTHEFSGTIKPQSGAVTLLVDASGKVTSKTNAAFTVPYGGFAVMFNSAVVEKKASRINVGDTITYDWEIETTFTKAEDWANVKQALGAGPSLIINGKVTADGTAEGFTEAKINTNRAGRSFIGSKADGTVLIGNIGSATLKEAAAVCQGLGLTNAMCLDGGGSVGLYYNGSKAAGRAVNNSLGFFKQAEKPIAVYLDGEQLSFSQNPYVANGVTMVPMRAIFEALGATVNYDAAAKKIFAQKGDTAIELVLDNKTATVNSETKTLDAAATAKSGSTLVPLRFVAEALQTAVNWDGASRVITIESK